MRKIDSDDIVDRIAQEVGWDIAEHAAVETLAEQLANLVMSLVDGTYEEEENHSETTLCGDMDDFIDEEY